MKLPGADEAGAAGASLFVKLEAGATVRGIFVGDPIFFRQIWEQGKEKQIFAATSDVGKWRFRCNFLELQANGTFQMKIMEQGAMIYEQMVAINKEVPLEECLVAITRTGAGMNTKYSLVNIKTVPAEKRTELAHAHELLDLDPHKDASAPLGGSQSPARQPSMGSFDGIEASVHSDDVPW